MSTVWSTNFIGSGALQGLAPTGAGAFAKISGPDMTVDGTGASAGSVESIYQETAVSSTADCKFRVEFIGLAGSPQLGIGLRVQTGGNKYVAIYGGAVYTYNGSFVSVANTTPSVSTVTRQFVELEVVGQVLTVRCYGSDGVTVLSTVTYTDSANIATSAGIWEIRARSVKLFSAVASDSVAPDTAPPTLGGSVTISGITTSGATASWSAGSDAVGVASYETSLDGSTWTDRGNVLTYALTGLTASTAYTARVRAKDAAGNVSTPAITGTFTTSAGPATATTLTGPSGGLVSVASGSFTAGANGTITGSVTVTPSDGGGGGTFSPTSVAISSGTPTATFTYTPGSAGAKTISISDTGSLTDATPLTYTATITSGTLTSSPLKNNTGTLLTSAACEAYVSNASTGALVVKKTGLTSHSSTGVVTFTDGAVVAATAYRVVWRMTVDGAEGLETLTAT